MTAIVRLLTHAFGNASYWATPHALGVLPRRETEAVRREAMKKRALIVVLVLTLLVGAGLYWAVSA